MTTVGARLVQLAGRPGTAAALLRLIGAAETAGAALVNYSGRSSGTMIDHLAVNRHPAVPPAPTFGGGSGGGRRVRGRYRRDDELIWMGGARGH